MTNSGHNQLPAIPDHPGDGTNNGGNISIDRVEWSRITILDFIEDYRSFNVLWDPNTKGYHIKQVKYEALKQLSRKYGTEVRVIRSKIKSLRSSFHREHGKVISGKRRGVNYQPTWFAYEAIRFILDGERNYEGGAADIGNNSSFDAVCGIGGGEHDVFAAAAVAAAAAFAAASSAGAAADTVLNGIDAKDELMAFTDPLNDPHYANISAEDVKTELLESSTAEDLSRSQKSTPKNSSSRKSKNRLRTLKNDSTSQQQLQTDSDTDTMDSTSEPCKKKHKLDVREPDEFGVFGEYVGITIRKLKSSKAQVVIKHLINNLLYDAEMGKYDYGIPTTREPPHLYATTD